MVLLLPMEEILFILALARSPLEQYVLRVFLVLRLEDL